jgi:hypothetical protein
MPRLIEEVHGGEPEVAAKLSIEERELETGWLNWTERAGLLTRPAATSRARGLSDPKRRTRSRPDGGHQSR